ncbi:MAG: hypothetical protein K2H40_00425 [Lachnospiraceae bacterium]|nr:hypothetical protein [Lachnospiraceae bacterium]
MTERFASIEDISGKIELAELDFDYTDDEWGNSGTLHIHFWGDSIYVEILNYKIEPLFETDKKYYTKAELVNEPMLVIHSAKNEIYAIGERST